MNDSTSAIGLMKLAVEEHVEDGEWRWRMQILEEAVPCRMFLQSFSHFYYTSDWLFTK